MSSMFYCAAEKPLCAESRNCELMPFGGRIHRPGMHALPHFSSLEMRNYQGCRNVRESAVSHVTRYPKVNLRLTPHTHRFTPNTGRGNALGVTFRYHLGPRM
jgi:hypothetical protein